MTTVRRERKRAAPPERVLAQLAPFFATALRCDRARVARPRAASPPESANDMRTRTVLVLAGCVLALGAGCGDGGISAADVLEADHRIGLIPTATADVEKVQRIGAWNGSDNVFTAWLKVTLKEGAPYVVCISVIRKLVDNKHDLSLVVTSPPESACKGNMPKP